MQQENILHIDMDAFYAAVEQRDFPEYRGKPIAVCGRTDQRGVVSTSSYEARKFGVHSAMPVRTAMKKCPHLILVQGRFNRYTEVSEKIMDVFCSFTPLVEPSSIDEAYLDVTGSLLLFHNATKIARMIKQRIKDEFLLTCSIGIAPNKLLAKIASNFKKPDGLFLLKKSEVESFLDNLKVEVLPGLGPKTAEIFHQQGVILVKDLKRLSREHLVRYFGIYGEHIFKMARGIDDSVVIPASRQEEKSISNETTLDHDITDGETINKILLSLSDQVARRLRNHKLKARTIKLKVKYFDFKTITRQITLSEATDLSAKIYKTVLNLFSTISLRPVRLLGVGSSGFDPGEEQLSLFQNKKLAKVERSVDSIRERFGSNSIKRASLLED
ncbi:MAG: DNA polymerase IV [Spirochaetes bacterium]|nr:DNA polymerase IV [Spirochaetota bacterium]